MPRAKGGKSELSRSEMERVIYEANLGEEDSYIARRYFIDRIPQIDIAAEVEEQTRMGISRSAVGRRLQAIRTQLRRTAQKLAILPRKPIADPV